MMLYSPRALFPLSLSFLLLVLFHVRVFCHFRVSTFIHISIFYTLYELVDSTALMVPWTFAAAAAARASINITQDMSMEKRQSNWQWLLCWFFHFSFLLALRTLLKFGAHKLYQIFKHENKSLRTISKVEKERKQTHKLRTFCVMWVCVNVSPT